jgi:hypothetical protein
MCIMVVPSAHSLRTAGPILIGHRLRIDLHIRATCCLSKMVCPTWIGPMQQREEKTEVGKTRGFEGHGRVQGGTKIRRSAFQEKLERHLDASAQLACFDL